MNLDFSMYWHGKMTPVKTRLYRSFKGHMGIQLDGAIFNNVDLGQKQLELLIVALRQLREGMKQEDEKTSPYVSYR